ncbi:unnamed protein product [Urochloa humidicola]
MGILVLGDSNDAFLACDEDRNALLAMFQQEDEGSGKSRWQARGPIRADEGSGACTPAAGDKLDPEDVGTAPPAQPHRPLSQLQLQLLNALMVTLDTMQKLAKGCNIHHPWSSSI